MQDGRLLGARDSTCKGCRPSTRLVFAAFAGVLSVLMRLHSVTLLEERRRDATDPSLV